MRSLVTTTLVALGLSLGGAAFAQQSPAKGAIQLRNVAEVETTTNGPDGKPRMTRAPATKAAPGTEVIYTTAFKNVGNKPAAGVVINNQVPANTTLVGGSAYGDNTDVTFSADGGKTYGAADKVKVRGADGKERPAGLTEFTHIRWTYRGELAAGKESKVGFRVTVN